MLEDRAAGRHKPVRGWLYLAAPMIGAFLYAGVLSDLSILSDVANVGAPGHEGVLSLLRAVFVHDIWFAIPVAFLVNAYCSKSRNFLAANWLVLIIAGICVCAILVTNVHPRILAPLLPLMAVALGVWIAALDRVAVYRRNASSLSQFAVLALFLAAFGREIVLDFTQDSRLLRDSRPYNLTDQYFRLKTFRPTDTILALRKAKVDEIVVLHEITSWDLAAFYQREEWKINSCMVVPGFTVRCLPSASSSLNEAKHFLVIHWDQSGAQEIAEKAAALLGKRLKRPLGSPLNTGDLLLRWRVPIG
jgi:hypothetical protein